MDIHIADNFRQTYPQASIGIVAMAGVDNPPDSTALAEYVHELEADLRSRWAGATKADLNSLPEFEAYRNYYKRFD